MLAQKKGVLVSIWHGFIQALPKATVQEKFKLHNKFQRIFGTQILQRKFSLNTVLLQPWTDANYTADKNAGFLLNTKCTFNIELLWCKSELYCSLLQTKLEMFLHTVLRSRKLYFQYGTASVQHSYAIVWCKSELYCSLLQTKLEGLNRKSLLRSILAPLLQLHACVIIVCTQFIHKMY